MKKLKWWELLDLKRSKFTLGNIVRVLLSVVLLSGVAAGMYFLFTVPGQIIYSGSEVFSTTGEYQDFKAEVIKPGIERLDVTVLSSEPPIIVDFKIEVDSLDTQFPYGEVHLEGFTSKGLGGLIGFGFFSAFITAFSTFLIADAIWDKVGFFRGDF